MVIVHKLLQLKFRFVSRAHLLAHLRRLGHYVTSREKRKLELNLVCQELMRRNIPLDTSTEWVVREYEKKASFRDHLSKTVSLKKFLSLASKRQSVRYYSPKKISSNIIKYCIMAGIQAPSSCNRQPWRLKIVDKKKDLRFLRQIRRLRFIEESSAAIIVFVDLNCYDKRPFPFSDETRYTPYFDAAMLVQNILLAATAAGIGSCCINMGPMEIDCGSRKRLYSHFNIPEHYRLMLLTTLGHPLKIPLKPIRNEVDGYLF